MLRVASWVETQVHGCELRLRGNGIEIAIELDSPHLSSEIAMAFRCGLGIDDALSGIPFLGSEIDAIRQTLVTHGFTECSLKWDASVDPSIDQLHAKLRKLMYVDRNTFHAVHTSAINVSTSSLWSQRCVSSNDCAVAQLHFATCLSLPIAEKGFQVRGDSCQSSNRAAVTVAMMETLERIYAVYSPPMSVMKSKSIAPQGIKLPSLSPTAFQYADNIDDTNMFDWVRATRLVDGKQWLVPARTSNATSNGCAAHSSFESATLNAILEAIERDSLLYYWLTRRSPAIIVDADMLLARVPLASSLLRLGFRITLLDGNAGLGMPVLLGIFEDDQNPAIFMLNAASGTTIDAALDKLCREFVMVMRNYFEKGEMSTPQARFGQDLHSPKTPYEHFDYYQTASRAVATSFLVASSVRRTERELGWYLPAEANDQLETVVQRLARGGIDVFAIDCTTQPLHELGIRVTKVLAPGLIPMYFDEKHRPVTVPRLLNPKGGRLNPWPHPFC